MERMVRELCMERHCSEAELFEQLITEVYNNKHDIERFMMINEQIRQELQRQKAADEASRVGQTGQPTTDR